MADQVGVRNSEQCTESRIGQLTPGYHGFNSYRDHSAHGPLRSPGRLLCTTAPGANGVDGTEVIGRNHMLLVWCNTALLRSFPLEKPSPTTLNTSFPLYRINDEGINWLSGTMVGVSTGCSLYFCSSLKSYVFDDKTCLVPASCFIGSNIPCLGFFWLIMDVPQLVLYLKGGYDFSNE